MTLKEKLANDWICEYPEDTYYSGRSWYINMDPHLVSAYLAGFEKAREMAINVRAFDIYADGRTADVMQAIHNDLEVLGEDEV